MKNNKYSVFYFFIFIIVAFLIMFYYVKKQDEKLKKNGSYTEATIKDISVVLKGSGVWVKYCFNLGKKPVLGKRIIYIESAYLHLLRENLLGKKFPVMYDTLGNLNNEIFIFRNEFLKYKLNTPDSLNGVFSLLDSLRFDNGNR